MPESLRNARQVENKKFVIRLLLFFTAIAIIVSLSFITFAHKNKIDVQYKHIIELQAKNDELEQTKILNKKKRDALIKLRINNWVNSNAKDNIPLNTLSQIVDIGIKYPRWKLIFAVMAVESNFDPFVTSHKRAGGLMQVMYSVWKDELEIESLRDIYDMDKNIFYGDKILGIYLDETDGDVGRALLKYVGGDKSYQAKVLVKYAELDFYINNTPATTKEEVAAAYTLPVSDTAPDLTGITILSPDPSKAKRYPTKDVVSNQ